MQCKSYGKLTAVISVEGAGESPLIPGKRTQLHMNMPLVIYVMYEDGHVSQFRAIPSKNQRRRRITIIHTSQISTTSRSPGSAGLPSGSSHRMGPER